MNKKQIRHDASWWLVANEHKRQIGHARHAESKRVLSLVAVQAALCRGRSCACRRLEAEMHVDMQQKKYNATKRFHGSIVSSNYTSGFVSVDGLVGRMPACLRKNVF